MSVHNLISVFNQDPGFRSHIAHIKKFPESAAKYGTLKRSLPPMIGSWLEQKGIRLFSHQCTALDHIREGHHVILTTATASGKSLAFNLPIFEDLLSNPDSCALYLYPTKALANDQLKSIQELQGYLGLKAHAAIYDGDTPRHRRPGIRESSRIVLSNPHELHHILPWHHKWSRYFGNLRFIVIDEAHRYRGLFGSHLAFLFRRLIRIAALYGAEPIFILSTATVANPGEFAYRLTGKRCAVIDQDGSPSGERYFVLYNPFITDQGNHSTHQSTSDILARCVEHDLQTLCFTLSRKMAELITRRTRAIIEKSHRFQPPEIAAYRAGYLPEDRRYLEQSLKTGSVRGVVSTNALEVGIDVGTLDAVIISGFPGTLMSVWQQAGRAGRRQGPSLATMVAFHNPLDQYFMHHPQTFFSKPHEHAIVDLKNPYIIAGHLLCAAAEAPLHPDDANDLFGSASLEMLERLAERKLLRLSRKGWIYAGRGRAVDAFPLSGISADSFRIVCDGKILETMDRSQAYREAHPGAVLLHQGETYIVDDFDLDAKRIRVKREEVDYYTEVLKSVNVAIQNELEVREKRGIELRFGDVEVIEHYHGYRVKRFDTVIAYEPLNLPPIQFITRAFWFTIPDAVASCVETDGCDLAGGLHAAEHAIIGMMPFHVMCDRWDIGGFSAPYFPETGRPTIMIYDGIEGGMGLSEKAFELFSDIIATSCDLVKDCSCETGCPACILSPKCGNENQPLDKSGARRILEGMSDILSCDPTEVASLAK